jgi:hypothetical protein
LRKHAPFPTSLFLVGAAVLGCGCGGPGREGGRECPEFPGHPRRESFTFVLTQGIRPENVPVPTNDSEAILFALTYPTLLEADCDGKLAANLADAWDPLPQDSSWTFRLGHRATFANGSRLEPVDVKETWTDGRGRQPPRPPWMREVIRPASIRVLDDGRLLVRAPAVFADLPAFLTHPAWAILRDDVPPWPLGTRGTLVEPQDISTTDAGDCVWDRGDRSSAGAARIVFRVMRGIDPRDAVQTGADAFFVRDRRVLGYLEQAEGFRVTPFPYSRLYVMVTPDANLARRLESEDIDDLARRVAIGEARPARDAEEFRVENGKRRGTSRDVRDRILFPRGDRDARAIAERFSFLWTRGRGTSPAIAPKKPSDFWRELRDGGDRVYVLPVFPRLPGSEQLRRSELLRAAPWLREHGGAVPLIETRGHLVTREGLTGFEAGYDGMPRLDRAGWRMPGAVP